ncbi:MAG: tetratricopeptide repeat protein [Magnetococcus sp. THC-1_WYH]
MNSGRRTFPRMSHNVLWLACLLVTLWLPGGKIIHAADWIRAEQSGHHDQQPILPFLHRMVGDCETKGWYGKALTYQTRLLAGLAKHWGENHPQVLRESIRKSRLLLRDGRLKEGKKILATLENHVRRLLGEYHVETAMIRLNQAQLALYFPEGAENALRWIDAVIPVLERSLWPDHPQRIEAMMVRGRALSSLGRQKEAEKNFTDLLRHCIAYLGPLDRSVAETLSAMGWNRIRMGRYQEGVGDLARGLAIFEQNYYPMTFNNRMTLLGRLAEGYLRGGQWIQAHAVLENVLAEMEKKQGNSHKALAKPLTDLGMVELELGQLAQSETHLKRALALVQQGETRDHPQVAFILVNLGDLFGKQGKEKEQEHYFAEAQSAAESFFAGDTVGLANWLASMAIILHQGGHQKQADALFSQSYQLLETALGKDDPAVVGVRESLSRLSRTEAGKKGDNDTKGAPLVTVEPFEHGKNEPGSELAQRRRFLMDAFKLTGQGEDAWDNIAFPPPRSVPPLPREKTAAEDWIVPEPLPKKSHVIPEQN